jgi:hypothetical protein
MAAPFASIRAYKKRASSGIDPGEYAAPQLPFGLATRSAGSAREWCGRGSYNFGYTGRNLTCGDRGHMSRSCRIYLRYCQAGELGKEFGSTGSRLIVNTMARGIYLIGSKREERVRAVQIVDRAGNSTTLRLKDYMSRKIQPGYTALPWQQDFMLQENDSKPTKQTADK